MMQRTYAIERKNPRYPFVADAEITLQDGSWLPAQLSQLSARGCYVDTLDLAPVGTELHLAIRDGAATCELPGKVLYERAAGLEVVGMGVLFGDLQTEQLSVIDRWIKAAAARTTVPKSSS